MNIITIVCDTFRRDHLGCYGNDWIHTENLNDFASKSVVFDRAYCGSFPTGHMRHDLFTGTYTFAHTFRDWKLEDNELAIQDVLRSEGYMTMLINDCPHILGAKNFQRGFNAWWHVRGQEFDPYMTAPSRESSDRNKFYGEQYAKNIIDRVYEKDFVLAKTAQSAIHWLELNYKAHKNFFLHIEFFDPHEPWDPPQWYTDLYYPDWEGDEHLGPAYTPKHHSNKEMHDASSLSGEELKHLNALYAGNVTQVDRWVGKLLKTIEDMGLFEDTLIVFLTDHGTLIGEHGYIHKRGYGGVDPLYEEVARIPLIMHFPDSMDLKGRCDELVSVPDIMPTLADAAKIELSKPVEGKSILPVLNGDKESSHDYLISCGGLVRPPARITVTTKDWSMIPINDLGKNPDAEDQTLLDEDDLGRPLKPELYNIKDDPKQSKNLYFERKDIVKEMTNNLMDFLESLGVGEKFFREKKSVDLDSSFQTYSGYD